MKCKKLLAFLLAAGLTLGAPALAAEGFPDVAEEAFYAPAVQWAVEQEITNGTGDGLFAPDATVTRSQAVAFLWRMAGCPAPTQVETFTDVENDPNKVWYETAVQWAVEQGITKGTGDGMFSPEVICDRAMILTMIYRMEGSPFDEALSWAVPEDSDLWTWEDLGAALVQATLEAIREEGGLADVKEGDYFEVPIAWAMLNDILNMDVLDDVNPPEAQPNRPCPRGEMVFFLYRTALYEEEAAAAEFAYAPLEPIETGEVPETVVMDKDGVKITLTGIQYASDEDVWLDLTAQNSTDKELYMDTASLYVNTFYTSASTFIPVEEEYFTSYEDVVVPAGESRDFHVCLNYLRERDTTAVYELELQMYAYSVTETEEEYIFEDYAMGDPVTIHTSLYDPARSYDLEGVTIVDKDGWTAKVFRAENNQFMGPQISVFGSNTGGEYIYLELAELTLDGVKMEASMDLGIEPGKRSSETVYIDVDYENVPTAKEAQLSFQRLDPNTWEVIETYPPVTITFAE